LPDFAPNPGCGHYSYFQRQAAFNRWFSEHLTVSVRFPVKLSSQHLIKSEYPLLIQPALSQSSLRTDADPIGLFQTIVYYNGKMLSSLIN
jgi:hypothetical protein